MDEIIHHLAVLFQDCGKSIFWRGKYENNSGVFHQVSENTWFSATNDMRIMLGISGMHLSDDYTNLQNMPGFISTDF